MESIFEAVLADDKELERVLKADPVVARATAARDVLVDAIPHRLYVGDTALHLAAAALRQGAVRRLLQAGADVNAENRRRATPLHYACDPRPNTTATGDVAVQAGALDLQLEIIALLRRDGADMTAQDATGRTPIAWARNDRVAQAIGVVSCPPAGKRPPRRAR